MYIAENCTQCMECITACPDTALPNTSQDVSTILKTAANYYVTETAERHKLLAGLKGIEERARLKMNDAIKKKESLAFKNIIHCEVMVLTDVSDRAKLEFTGIIDKLPLAAYWCCRRLPVP